MIRDIALVEHPEGRITVHRANCPDARQAAYNGLPVATLMGIEGEPPKDLPWHSCMTDPCLPK